MPSPQGFGTVCEVEAYEDAALAPGVTGTGACAPECPVFTRSPGFGWMVLQRHGKRPLAVLGRTLLQAGNRCAGLPCWSEIFIHETAASRFAVSVRHQSREIPSTCWTDAWLCENPEEVRAMLYAHDPVWALPPRLKTPVSLTGFPAGIPVFEDGLYSDALTAQRLRGAWGGLLAAIFGLSSASWSVK